MKKIFALILCLVLLFSLAACGGSEGTSDSAGSQVPSSSGVSGDASSDGASDAASDDESSDGASADEESESVPNLVIANDQIKNRAVVYDLDRYEEGDRLEDLEVWSVDTGHAAGVKYREDTVYGDVVIVAGSNVTAIYGYPSKEIIWSTTNPGRNPHSIEILPSGNIVVANSTGDCLRFFYASAVLDGNTADAQTFVDCQLEGAHGVLWDPEYDVLWALGGYELAAYVVVGSGTSQKLTKVGGMGCSIENLGYGHDLQPDFTDTRYLYFTAGNVYRFDKENNTAGGFPHSAKFQLKEIKGFSNNPNDCFFSTGELGGAGKFFKHSSKESWLTDTILFYTKEEVRGKVKVTKTEFVSDSSAFYKVRSFYGKYQ